MTRLAGMTCVMPSRIARTSTFCRCGSRSILVSRTRSALRNVDVLAEIVNGRTDQVADVLDEHVVELRPPFEMVEGMVDHLCVQMTRIAGRDRQRRHPRACESRRVAVRREITGEGTAPAARLEPASGRFEDRRLARTWGSHQIDREHAMAAEVIPVVLRETDVAREDMVLDLVRDDVRIPAAA